MRSRSLLAALGAVVAVLLVPPLIGAVAGDQDTTQLRGLKFLVPNAPGGGYDVTARTAAKALEDAKLTGAIEVFNLPGAGGTVGLGRTVNESGDDRLVMSMGLGVVGSVFTNSSPATLADVTPIARLTQETEVVVVGKDSPLRTMADLLAAWKANPAGAAGGWRLLPRRPGPPGPDADRGGGRDRPAGRQLRGLRRRRRAAGRGARQQGRVRGVRAGRVRRPDRRRRAAGARGDRGPSARPAWTRPTLREAGVDVEFTNWRGIVAPPDLEDRAAPS